MKRHTMKRFSSISEVYKGKSFCSPKLTESLKKCYSIPNLIKNLEELHIFEDYLEVTFNEAETLLVAPDRANRTSRVCRLVCPNTLHKLGIIEFFHKAGTVCFGKSSVAGYIAFDTRYADSAETYV